MRRLVRCAKLPVVDRDLDAKAWLAGVFDRAAPTYDEVAGAYHDHFGARLVELAGVGPGDAVLDVGCGRGAVLIPAAVHVGPSGRAVGVDISPEMVRLARSRVESATLDAELYVMDGERLEVPDGSFSVVLCGFGIFFMPHPDEAVTGFHRALAPGGTVAISTWGAEDGRWSWEDDLFADVVVARRAVQQPFDRADHLGSLLLDAGFDDVEVRAEHHDVRLADADEWWAWKWSYSLRGVLEQLAPERLDRVRREASQQIASMTTDDGIPLRLEALIAVGHR
jgi:ubiquinone/menaquinone biosynthesis C-methylase UbiE